MASAQYFDIEPVARFHGVSAGIRRPKVGLFSCGKRDGNGKTNTPLNAGDYMLFL
jgi:hypothetical protein